MGNSRFKFRAWNMVFETMEQWNHVRTWEALGQLFVSDEYIFEQFTGLKDIDGKDIYEGDVCSSREYYFGDNLQNGFNGTIIFVDGCFLLDGIGDNGCELDGTTIRNQDIKVIGNIHENQELLK